MEPPLPIIKSIEENNAVIGIVGLGYVGLPLLLEFSRVGLPVLGLDVDEGKTTKLLAGESYIRHITSESIAAAFSSEKSPKADATTDFKKASDCHALLICVPTPLTHHRDPDLSFVKETASMLAPHLRPGQLIVLESTTYPGTTEDVLVPVLEAGSGLKAGQDFFVAYSPEREDPNNTKFGTSTIPKVVGGIDENSRNIAQALYDRIICETVPVKNCRTAEATKLVENIFRCVNIALVNELKLLFTEMDINVWEVIDAAKTKPFGFMPFYPGPGLGGHCIPIDPFYLTWKAREYGMATRFIELAGEINTAMPDYVAQRTLLGLNAIGKPLKGARLLLVGLAYKKNVDDDRESPTYVLWSKFEVLGAEVRYYDPYCPAVKPIRQFPAYEGRESVAWEDITAENFDVAVVATAHDDVDHDELTRRLPLVVDTRGACAPAENLVQA